MAKGGMHGEGGCVVMGACMVKGGHVCMVCMPPL